MKNNKDFKVTMAQHIEKDIKRQNLTISEKISDVVTYFLGTWTFLILINMIIFGYIILQEFDGFDKQLLYLNFGLSYFAAIGQSIIMMSQNRISNIDRNHMQIDFEVNKESKNILEKLNQKIDNQDKQILELKNLINDIKKQR